MKHPFEPPISQYMDAAISTGEVYVQVAYARARIMIADSAVYTTNSR